MANVSVGYTLVLLWLAEFVCSEMDIFVRV